MVLLVGGEVERVDGVVILLVLLVVDGRGQLALVPETLSPLVAVALHQRRWRRRRRIAIGLVELEVVVRNIVGDCVRLRIESRLHHRILVDDGGARVRLEVNQLLPGPSLHPIIQLIIYLLSKQIQYIHVCLHHIIYTSLLAPQVLQVRVQYQVLFRRLLPLVLLLHRQDTVLQPVALAEGVILASRAL